MSERAEGRRVRTNLRWRNRFIKRFVSFAVFFLYERVEVFASDLDDLPEDVPVLAVSNHFGGFADPFLLVYASPVVPRIVARDKIWKVPFAGWIMNAIGAIPVHKPKEQKGPTSNKDMFSSCYQALAAGEPLLIFPEGITREDPSIAPVKTGAARIALGAREEGTSGIRILPIGIHYEDKAALRSKVFINAGTPIDLDATIDRYAPEHEATPENRDAVGRLTADIELYLRRVAPNFSDWHEAKAMTQAAEVTLRSEADDPADPVSIADRDMLAANLARVDQASKDDVMSATEDLDADLSGLGLTDAEVYDKMGTGSFVGFLIRSALVLLVAIPLALIGLTVNIWPLLLIGAIGFLPVEPAVKATAKPAGAILFFGIAWSIALWQALRESVVAGVIAGILLPVSLAALVYASERVVRLAKVAKQWIRGRRVEAIGEQVVAKRAAVRHAVRTAVPR
jgi:1-acyl-sn-glycerol-3-phosphate acyltransferase